MPPDPAPSASQADSGSEAGLERRSAVAVLPSAWPLLACITLPMKKPVSLPRALSSPVRKSSHSSGWAAMTVSTIPSSGAGVEGFEALLLGDRSRVVAGGDHLGEHGLRLRGGEGATVLQGERARRGARDESGGGALHREVVLDVGEHPGGVGSLRDGAQASPSRSRWTAITTASSVGSRPAAAAKPGRGGWRAGAEGTRRSERCRRRWGSSGTSSGSGKNR